MLSIEHRISRARRIASYPVKRARAWHSCWLCKGDILPGERGHAKGSSLWTHPVCLRREVKELGIAND